ncbi:lipoyl synthase [Candidatus Formimonas warabiya]|uniref:Lipoyl synthase n=2 Tax=Formimonas warabiya TaxID=1761012 RepID=A0A3G1L2C0_FORW1|nr:lipoyl synthase [Candidatus Formimonas warabiya]
MHTRKPDWLKIKLLGAEKVPETERILRRLSLHTVCKEANCPNLMECFAKKTATFMILGQVCTRNCTFCNVIKGEAQPVDPDEPAHIAEAVKALQLKHVVITSVTRDDLADGGAGHFAQAIRCIKRINESILVEVLIPDFRGDQKALSVVVKAKPDILNHNVETVPRLYPSVRPLANYQRSLELLRVVKKLDPGIYTKSGIMVGLGEEEQEIRDLMQDLRAVDCDLLTIGQYLAPSKQHHAVVAYIHPEIFAQYKSLGEGMGFKYVASAPFVRSSYHADEAGEILKATPMDRYRSISSGQVE